MGIRNIGFVEMGISRVGFGQLGIGEVGIWQNWMSAKRGTDGGNPMVTCSPALLTMMMLPQTVCIMSMG